MHINTRTILIPCLAACSLPAAGAGNPDVLYPTQEYIDWADNKSITAIVDEVFTGGDIFNRPDLAAGPIGKDLVSAGAQGQAFDVITGRRWINTGGSFYDTVQGDSVGNPIADVTAMAAFNDTILFATAQGHLAVWELDTGETAIHEDIFLPGIGGLTAETGPDGGLRLIEGNGTAVRQHAVSDLFGDIQLIELYYATIDGQTALAIQGMDWKDGYLYTTTIAGTAEFPYELLPANANCPADLTSDGLLDFFDISDFLNAYTNQEPAADFNTDGRHDFFDVSAFLNAFTTGCP